MKAYLCGTCGVGFRDVKDKHVTGPCGHPGKDGYCEGTIEMVPDDDQFEQALWRFANKKVSEGGWKGGPKEGYYRKRPSSDGPVNEYLPPDDWKYPEVIKESRVDKVSLLRTCAMPNMNQYGNCYEHVYINFVMNMKKSIWYERSRSEALKSHDTCLEFVISQKRGKQ